MLKRKYEGLAGGGVPDPRGVVVASGDHASAVGTERSACHLSLMNERECKALLVAASQICAVLSQLAVTTRVPSELNAAPRLAVRRLEEQPVPVAVTAEVDHRRLELA